MSRAVVYLIPTILDEEGLKAISDEVRIYIHQCQVFFTENLRTSRRYLKKLDKKIQIDEKEWYQMDENNGHETEFIRMIRDGKKIGILSEAGCPGVADPGHHLVAIAHRQKAEVRPITGPSSILLALMASGMNGQQFCFNGYLPVKESERADAIRRLEALSAKTGFTQIFIETPYRNHQVFETICKICRPDTMLCIAVELTGKNERIRTMKINEWQKQKAELHKKPAIFLLHAD